MATITSTIDDFNLQSNYKCNTIEFETTSANGGYARQFVSISASNPSVDSEIFTFSYENISSEKVNMAVLSLTSISNTYGGNLSVNGTRVYPSNGVYTIYLEPADLGETSTTFEFKFTTYTPTHGSSHLNSYDSRTYNKIVEAGSSYTVAQYTLVKNHTGTLSLSDITLKIYTGDDFVAVPTTSALFIGVNNIAKKVTDIYTGVNNVAKKVTDGWIGINGVARKFWPCLELQNVTPGGILKLDEKGDGNLVDYIVVAQDHYLNDINTERHTVLMRKNLLDTTSTFGDNTTGEAYIGEALDNYINEAWKATLDGRIILKLMNITIPCNKWTGPYTSSAERQVWVPSWSEIKETYTDEPGEGTCFEYFIGKDTNADRIAKTSDGTAQVWWTRSCLKGMGNEGALVRVITSTGNLNSYGQGTPSCRCRPVFCLPAGLPTSKVSEGIYDLIL